MNMEQWKERYPEQFAVLSSRDAGRYALEEYDGVSSLSVYATTPAMTEDFEYLTIFPHLTTLSIMHVIRQGELQSTIHLGCNLHKNRMLKVLTVYCNISSFHEDFALVAPQLTTLKIFGKINLYGAKWNFNNLKELHVGIFQHVSTTDFKWCQNAPVLMRFIFTSTDISELKSSLISKSVETLRFFDCDISDIALLSELSNLKEILFTNTNFKKFPMEILSMKNLVKITINNTQTGRSQFKNVFADEIMFESAFSHVKELDLNYTGVQKLTICAAGNHEFDLRAIRILNISFFDPGCNLSIDDPNEQMNHIEIVHVSGRKFLDILLMKNTLFDYTGGYILSDEWKRTHRQFDADDFPDHNAGEARREILFHLRDSNPTVPFINIPEMDEDEEWEDEEWEEPDDQDIEETHRTAEDAFNIKEQYNHDHYAERVEEYAREIPYFCVYTSALQSTFGVDPFDPASGAQCNMCFEPFVQEEHDNDADTSTGFVRIPIDDPVPTNGSVVFCNLTEHDAELAADGDTSERIALHLKKEHLFHLSCFQRWVRAAILRDTVPDCAINRDKFYREN